MQNRHPVDQLKDIRLKIAELKKTEASLKDEIMNGECGVVGDENVAVIQTVERRTMSNTLLKKKMGEDWFNDNAATSQQTRISIGEK